MDVQVTVRITTESTVAAAALNVQLASDLHDSASLSTLLAPTGVTPEPGTSLTVAVLAVNPPSTPPPSPPPPFPRPPGGGDDNAAVIGGALGGAFGFLLLVAVAFFLVKPGQTKVRRASLQAESVFPSCITRFHHQCTPLLRHRSDVAPPNVILTMMMRRRDAMMDGRDKIVMREGLVSLDITSLGLIASPNIRQVVLSASTPVEMQPKQSDMQKESV